MSRKLLIFIHADLGIGVAKGLVIDAAIGFPQRGHTATLYTSHSNQRHCFDEAHDETLDVHVAGNTIIPPHFLGYFSIPCAILRHVHLTLTLLLTDKIVSKYGYMFIDQLLAAILPLRFFSPTTKILFPCHFPNFLAATRTSLIQSLYRIPFHWFKGFTTGLPDAIVVSWAFTGSVFAMTFLRIRLVPRRCSVCYYCHGFAVQTEEENRSGNRHVFRAHKETEVSTTLGHCRGLRCFARVLENVSYYSNLTIPSEKLGLKSGTSRKFLASLWVPEDTVVLFLLSISVMLKTYLLRTPSLRVYTTAGEHFGIVPLEAVIAGVLVLAHKSGGPLEIIEEGRTDEEWAAVMWMALFELGGGIILEMATRGRERVLELFPKEKMAEKLDDELDEISE
ncbi:hypothetical protein HOY80DRAFT_1007298 [Tuber brumale]|nr:hypothetical protein HOY80DRAFT_1007298 [Tuber brumale]